MKDFNTKLGHQGFTLIEIMVAMSLIVLVFVIIPVGTQDSERSQLEQAIFDFDRAVRFSENESILKNSIIRISIDLEKEPTTYTVEYSTSSTLTLPEHKDLDRMSIKEREADSKNKSKLDGKFSAIDEFSDGSRELPAGISIYAVATTYTQDLIDEGIVHIYFYPTGEKDNTIIILNNSIELASFKIPAFENITIDEFYPLSEYELGNFDNAIENKAKDIFTTWQKE